MSAPSPSAPAPEKLFVDSGVWLAYFSARDSRHAEADELMRAAIGRKIPLLTSNLVLAEIHRLLLHRAGIRPAAAALAAVQASPSVAVKFADAGVHREAVSWLACFSDQPFSYTDAASFAVMKAARCRAALSFDKHFAVAGYALWRGE